MTDNRQREVDVVTRLLWPSETIEEAALALCEEAGEVARAVIKRNHSVRDEGDRGGDQRSWTANLKVELAQVVVVCMKMAEREGFDLSDAVDEQIAVLRRRSRGFS